SSSSWVRQASNLPQRNGPVDCRTQRTGWSCLTNVQEHNEWGTTPERRELHWSDMILSRQIDFFETNHYLFIPAALTPDEVAAVNAAIDRDREEFPRLWSTGNRMQSAQCLLSMPEADFLIRHPAFFAVARHALDGDIRFEELSVMIRAGNS